MASVPSPSPPRRAPPPASDSATSTAAHSPKNQVEVAPNNGAFHGDEKKPDFADALDHLDGTRYIERFSKYDDEYRRRLLEKYFSGKINGGNIIYEQITVRGEIIKTSRLPCLRSYADPVVGFEDQFSNGSSPPVDTQANIPNGKHMVKNN
ncbi:uncharacterized protein LOC130731827 [Lotus japonicus]|uniref:Uncharacterized protein n=1 Tax=Lotus japonicus TaxID=34305 RepID=I3S274_LOTJA|nr:uncharacterized protein LOC130731827 [Lotus japonicus]AFK34366.1 unknown [Lotus japonicus]